MKTLDRNQLRDTTNTEKATAQTTDTADTTDIVNAGIAEVLRMRVGCWRAPVHFTTEPTAA